MKKNYIKPEMKVYEIETPQLLVGSPDINSNVPYDNNEGMW